MMVGPRWTSRLHASTIRIPNSVHPTRPSLVRDAVTDDDEAADGERESTSKSLVDRLYTYDSLQIIAIKLNPLAVTRMT